jgi:CRP-like cAMP-binding protein
MRPLHSPVGENALLARLPAAVYAVLRKHVRASIIVEATVLWRLGESSDLVYFPCSGMISIRVPTREGNAIEVANVGREAATGFDRGSGDARTTQAVMQVAGQVIAIPADRYAQAACEHEELAELARCCDSWLLLQAQQIAACNTVHSAEARLCRWLLRACDAIGGETISATQETIAEALGVRRTTATLIAQRLQMAGIISYSRGKIAIRDREALEAAACDCHVVLSRRNWPSLPVYDGLDAASHIAPSPRLPEPPSDRGA